MSDGELPIMLNRCLACNTSDEIPPPIGKSYFNNTESIASFNSAFGRKPCTT